MPSDRANVELGDDNIVSVLKDLRDQYSSVRMDPRQGLDWGLLPDAEEVGDPYQLLASMEDPSSRLMTSSVLRMDDDPAIDALIEMHNRVTVILYNGQKRQYRLAQAVVKQLDTAAENFTAERFAQLNDKNETYEAYVEKEMKQIALDSYEGVLEVSKRVCDETLDEMRAFHGLDLDGKTIEQFNVFSKIKNGFKSLGNKIKDGFKYLKDRINGLIKKLGEGFKVIIDGIKNIAHDVVDAFNAITDKILKPIANGFKKIIDTIILKPVNWIKNAAKKLWDKIKQIGVKIKNALVAAFEKVKAVIVKTISVVKNAIVSLFRKIRDGILKAFKTVKNAFIKLGKLVEKFGNAFANFFKTIFGGIVTIFKSIGNFFKKIFSFIKQGFWKVINAFKNGWTFIKCGVLNIAPWIKGVFKNFLLFFKNVLAVLKLLLKFLFQLITNPFKALFNIVLLLLGLVLSIILLLVYTIASLGPSILVGWVFSWAGALVLAVIETFTYAILVLIATACFIAIWIVNIASGGLLTFLLRCENKPDSWFNASGYHVGNLYKRFLMACYWPCSPGFENKWSYFCVKRQQSCPLYCPQQQIYGFLEQPEARNRLQPYMFERHLPDANFYTASIMAKRSILLKTMEKKKEFLGACMVKMKPYDFMNRSICANIEHLDGEKYPNDLKVKMANVCKQAYCDYQVTKAYNGAAVATRVEGGAWSGSWCKGLLDLAKPILGNQSSLSAAHEFLAAVYLLIVGTVVAIIAINMKGYMSVSAVKLIKTNPYMDIAAS